MSKNFKSEKSGSGFELSRVGRTRTSGSTASDCAVHPWLLLKQPYLGNNSSEFTTATFLVMTGMLIMITRS